MQPREDHKTKAVKLALYAEADKSTFVELMCVYGVGTLLGFHARVVVDLRVVGVHDHHVNQGCQQPRSYRQREDVR